MRMKIDRFWKLLPMLVLAILLAACQTNYTEEALQNARDYALENTRMLPEVARKYIRFATPKLQTTHIFSHQPMRLSEYDHISRNIDFNPRTDPGSATILAQFVWSPPRLGYSIIVIGQSHADLAYWTPLRVVLKNIAPYRKDYEAARTKAIYYVINNMLYLSSLERVRVRTSEAEVRETDFDLEYMFEEQLESSAAEWRRFLKTLRKQWERRQYSLIWKTDDGDRRIVITGLASIYGLKNWSAFCGMVIPAKQLDEYTVKIVVKDPDAPEEPTTEKEDMTEAGKKLDNPDEDDPYADTDEPSDDKNAKETKETVSPAKTTGETPAREEVKKPEKTEPAKEAETPAKEAVKQPEKTDPAKEAVKQPEKTEPAKEAETPAKEAVKQPEKTEPAKEAEAPAREAVKQPEKAEPVREREAEAPAREEVKKPEGAGK